MISLDKDEKDERKKFTDDFNYEMQITNIFNSNLLVYIKSKKIKCNVKNINDFEIGSYYNLKKREIIMKLLQKILTIQVM